MGGNFGSVTGKGRIVIQSYLKGQSKSPVNKSVVVDKSMTKDGSIIITKDNKYAKQTATPQAVSVQNNFSAAQLADAMGLLNQTLGSLIKSDNKTDNKKDSSPTYTQADASAQASAPSGISSGVSGAQSYDGASMAQNVNSVAKDLNANNKIDGIKEILQNKLNPMATTASSNLDSAKADYSVLLGQKDQAEADVSSLQAGIQTCSAEKENAEKSLSDNKSNLSSSLQARDKVDEQLSSLNSEYSGICDNVKEKESAKSQCQTSVSQSKSSVTTAEGEFKSASSAYESAQSALSNTEPTLEDGKPNPAYNAAKTACEKALAAKEKAQAALDKAKGELEKAESQLEASEKELSAAQTQKKEKLSEIKKTDSQHAKLVESCERNQNQVEAAQDSYDTSLENFDTTKNNYEKLNTELESAQGILTQCDEYENKIKDLQENLDKINDLKSQAEQDIRTGKESGIYGLPDSVKQLEKEMTTEQVNDVVKELVKNSNASDGCSVNKTILENLIAAKDADLSKCTGSVWVPSLNNTYGSAAELESQGYLKNQDGSFTDPRTGVTMINLIGDDHTWVSQTHFAHDGEITEWGSKAQAGRDYPGIFDAIERNNRQQDARINLNGFDDQGNPKFRRVKSRLSGYSS